LTLQLRTPPAFLQDALGDGQGAELGGEEEDVISTDPSEEGEEGEEEEEEGGSEGGCRSCCCRAGRGCSLRARAAALQRCAPWGHVAEAAARLLASPAYYHCTAAAAAAAAGAGEEAAAGSTEEEEEQQEEAPQRGGKGRRRGAKKQRQQRQGGGSGDESDGYGEGGLSFEAVMAMVQVGGGWRRCAAAAVMTLLVMRCALLHCTAARLPLHQHAQCTAWRGAEMRMSRSAEDLTSHLPCRQPFTSPPTD
jgi:hypothetical protein